MPLHPPGPWVRPALGHLLRASRTFSTRQPFRSDQVPPQSPSYIRLPSPPQSEDVKLERVRGRLPVPREIFPRREGDRKVQPGYMQRTAPEPTKRRDLSNEAQRWKAAMATNRRKNLEGGLQALWARRSESDKKRGDWANQKFAEHKRAVVAPEPEDERLTRGTVLDSMLDTKVYPDPERFSRARRSRAVVLARESAKREARRDALMELYISASNFIVEESELKAEVAKIFAKDYFKVQSQAMLRYGATENAWGTYGRPPSLATMLEASTGNSSKLIDFYETEYDQSAKRHKRITEDLTGGKMM